MENHKILLQTHQLNKGKIQFIVAVSALIVLIIFLHLIEYWQQYSLGALDVLVNLLMFVLCAVNMYAIARGQFGKDQFFSVDSEKIEYSFSFWRNPKRILKKDIQRIDIKENYILIQLFSGKIDMIESSDIGDRATFQQICQTISSK